MNWPLRSNSCGCRVSWTRWKAAINRLSKTKPRTSTFLARLLEDEVERRAQKQLELRLRRSTVNSTKTLESFDFGFNPNLNRQQILELATGNYIRQKKNVLLCGPTGTGKTHLAQALAHEACRQGFDVYFGNTHKLLQYLQAGRADHSFERRLHSLAHHVEILALEGASFRAKG
ncbi:MAG: hypothetical protein CME16_03455 [Gemmatimonadetes bacterium]|nr:hypothetical protein [Gemmatimonadota bacterium]